MAALIELAAELDQERRRGAEGGLWPIDARELCDALLLGSRDAAQRGSVTRQASVHLSTFHGAKGRELDKVVVCPSLPPHTADRAEEQRLYYVALTRARNELIVCSLGFLPKDAQQRRHRASRGERAN